MTLVKSEGWAAGADDPAKALNGSIPGRFEFRCAADIPAQVPDTRDRTDSSYLAYYHKEICPDLAKNGVLVALILAIVNGIEVLLDGETRRRGALEVGLKKNIPVLILEGPVDPTDLKILRFQLNNKRRNFSQMEQARFLFDAMKEKNWTQARLCKELHLIPGTVSRTFKVIEKLSEKLHAMIGDGPGKLSWRGAYAVCDLPPDQQEHWATQLTTDAMCIEDVERAIKGKKARTKRIVFKQKHTQVVLKTEDNAGAISELSSIIDNLKKKKTA